MQHDFSRRAADLREIMDDPACDEQLLFNTYRHFILINRLLSRWQHVYEQFLRPRMTMNQPCRILDVGFGGGDILRTLLQWGARDGRDLHITAIDPDERSHRYVAQQRWPGNVQFSRNTIQDMLRHGEVFDFVISNHLLHHLPDQEVVELADAATKLSRKLVVFNDIERSKFGYGCFRFAARLMLQNSLAYEDGLISIRRSFTRDELASLLPAGWFVGRMFPSRLMACFDHEKRIIP